jgi:hypothetical protein
MSKRNLYAILAEKYDSVYTTGQVKEVRQIPFTEDELRILTSLYDFKKEKDSLQLKRIPAAGEVETAVKYDDLTYIVMADDARGVTKHVFKSFYEMVQALSQTYKVDRKLAQQQTPYGKSFPGGVSNGGTGQTIGYNV